jgi:protein O-mannosyl-transferase
MTLIRGLNILLIGIVCALYANTLGHDYAFDDYGVILENNYTKSGISGLGAVLSTGYRTNATSIDTQLYRPLSKVMFALEWSISPHSPGLNHFVNVALFALTVVLLFNVLRSYISGSVLVPFLTAGLFALHPIHTEVVANIKGRDDILCFLLFVSAAQCAFKYASTQSTRYLVWLLLSFFLCCLSKESAIAFLIVIPLMLFFFTTASKEVYVKSMSALTGAAVSFLLIRAGVLTGPVPPVPVIDNYISGISGFLTQRTTAIYIAGLYLWKLIVPHPLVSDMSLAQLPVVGVGDWRFVLPFVIFAAAAVFAFMKLRDKDILAFSILYFFITFFMVSNIPFILGTNYGERLLYAPSLGICLAIAYALARFLQRTERVAGSASGFLVANGKAVAVTGVLGLVYGFLTVSRNAEWKDSLTLFRADVQKAPNSAKLHYFYANQMAEPDYLARFSAGDPERRKAVDTAAVEFQKALDLYPPYTVVMSKLAGMFVEQGKLDSAELYYRRAIRLGPPDATSRNNYGGMLFNQGRLNEAQVEFEAAVSINPVLAVALNNLASVHGARGSLRQSLEYSLRSIQADPDFAQAYETAALTYASLGDGSNEQKYKQLAERARLRTAERRTQAR